MSFGKDELFTALNVPVITNELDTFKTKPALWPDNVVSSIFIPPFRLIRRYRTKNMAIL